MKKVIIPFRVKKLAQDFQKVHGGKLLYAQWSNKYCSFTPIGDQYHKELKEAGISHWRWESEYKYIIVGYAREGMIYGN